MMPATYTKMALRALRSSRWRSFLTMLGVVAGVTSVVTIVCIGEGVKQQITRQVSAVGADVVTVRPGRLVERDAHGHVTKVYFRSIVASGSLTDADIATIRQSPGLANVVPFGLMTGVPVADGVSEPEAMLIGTSPDLPLLTNRKVAYGTFFGPKDSHAPAAVIGAKVAEELFKENAPIGRSFMLRGQEVIVRGVMEPSVASPQDLGLNYDRAIFMPYDFTKQLGGGQLQIYQVLARPAASVSAATAVTNVTNQLTKAHGGTADFTVLQAADSLAIASNALDLLTALIAAMAAVSLVVGGIGIMNIMFVAVSERTHEIGVRKSVGATNSQILWQFLIEAAVISAIGGVVGVLGSLLANYILRVTTSLQPAFDFRLMAFAVAGAIVLGSIFGLAPAVKAARKDPIDALRRIN